MKKWKVVVQLTGKQECRNAFEEWKYKNPEIAERLTPQDILTDVMRGENGKTEYRIRIFVEELNR